MKQTFSYDDVSLVPQYSNLSSRAEVNLSANLFGYSMRLPIIGSPMDCVVDIKMQKALLQAGVLGVHHRYTSKQVLFEAVRYGPIATSPSMGLDFVKGIFDIPDLSHCTLTLDVAHGDSKLCYDFAEACILLNDKRLVLISGNIVTTNAARRYLDIGVNTLRVGVGSGSVCNTRVVAGIGIPNITAIMDIRNACPEATILADGGLRSSGDIVKALACGADFVMLGRLLAGAKEAPGKRSVQETGDYYVCDLYPNEKYPIHKTMKEYRGMASQEALDAAGKERNVEGISTWIPEEGTVAEILDKLEGGIRAGFSYCGARNIQELHQKAEFVQVTHNGYAEGLPKL